MANWFPMALKEPAASISSWPEQCDQFLANFKGTYGRPLTKHDLQAVRQRSGETLHKYIQRFSKVRNEVPRVSEAEVISAFSTGVTDVHMREKLAVHDEINTVIKLFELADRCTKTEEGRLFAHNDPNIKTEEAPAKPKAAPKRKPQAVLAAEPEKKQPREEDVAPARREDRPFCAFHDYHGHRMEDCFQLKRNRPHQP